MEGWIYGYSFSLGGSQVPLRDLFLKFPRGKRLPQKLCRVDVLSRPLRLIIFKKTSYVVHSKAIMYSNSIRRRPSKPNQRKSQDEKFMNFALFCEFWCFSLGKQARFTLSFCSGMPLRKVHELTFLCFGLPRKVHELTFLCFGLPGPLLI